MKVEIHLLTDVRKISHENGKKNKKLIVFQK